MGIFESPAVDVDEATAANDIELDERAARAAVEDFGALPQTGFGAVARPLFRALCWLMLAAAVVYLGVAGMNYALISGVQIPEELRGTKILLTYSAVQALLFAAAGIAGLVGDCRADFKRYLRLAPLAPALLAVAAEVTQMFNMGDHVLDNRFIFGANFFFGILALFAGALAAVSLYLSYKQGDQQASEYGVAATVDTDPVAASMPFSHAAPAAGDSAQELVRDAAANAAPGALPEPDEAEGAVAELLEGADEELEGTFEPEEDGRSDGVAADDCEDEDEEEVERPHGAHF